MAVEADADADTDADMVDVKRPSGEVDFVVCSPGS